MTRFRHALEKIFVGNNVFQFFAKHVGRRSAAMIKNKTRFIVANEIAKTAEIGNKRGTAMRHRLERRKPERFAALGRRRINKNAPPLINITHYYFIIDSP